MDEKRKEKFGDLLLDTAKYLITAVILSTFFKGIEEWAWYTYVIAIAVVIAIIWSGLSLFEEDKDKRKKRR